ncbi:unnamed protein product [Coffea canephora]|uniref:Uncharacterized protein n=1 Tax=Coffea canephora TaxID=49390 RepID=A0A068V0S6_COFCA|nr:unnamed protein product [Coffea canephora]
MTNLKSHFRKKQTLNKAQVTTNKSSCQSLLLSPDPSNEQEERTLREGP